MALSVYKRGDYYWVRGQVCGRSLRRSLDTRNKEVAHHRAATLELGLDGGLQPLPLAEFTRRYLASNTEGMRARNAGILRALEAAFPARSYLHEFTSLDLEAFLRRKPRSANTVRYEISRLRAMWAWALRHQVVRANLAAALALPPAQDTETQPLDARELAALEAAIDTLAREPSLRGRSGTEPGAQPGAEALRNRTWAMYQVLRSSGIRVSDLIQLRPEHIQRGVLRTQKTKATIPIRLPQVTLQALAAVRPQPSGYYFWTGASYKGACDSVWRTFARLGQRAGLQGVHPHRLRDTFAVNLLAAGADLRLVSKMLGHSSIRTTEKHYAPWVRAFQNQADQAIAAAERAYQRGKRTRPARPPRGKTTKKAAR